VKKFAIKRIVVFAVLELLFITAVYADTGGLASVATSVLSSLAPVAKMITASSYIAGMGFFIGAILKFKAHKDNPTQIPVGTPIALVFIAAALIFLPALFGVAGKTIFGSATGTGGVSGVTTF